MDKISSFLKEYRSDIPAGIVVFLVAVPLCLGIALASGAPLFSGIIAGIIGGIFVGALSGSSLGVSGPAAGLAVIVLTAIQSLGFEYFLCAVMIAGLFQIILGYLKAGIIGYYFPNSVIKGMLSGIGLIILLKQIPHAFGYDADFEGSDSFIQIDGQNTFSELFHFLNFVSIGPSILGIVSLLILILWDMPFVKRNPVLKVLQGPMVVVCLGILYSLFFGSHEMLGFKSEQLVQLPILNGLSDISSLIVLPNFMGFTDASVWISGLTMAIVASIETLLCVEATDKLDPLKRVTPPNRELKAQGIGNLISGLIGGLPITQVIVRSSANIQSGAKTKMSAIYHGFFILICALAIPNVLNLLPLACLAAILIMVGYKLAKPQFFKDMWAKGTNQFIPYLVTIIAILFTDLLTGITIGLATSVVFLLIANFRNSFYFDETKYHKEDTIRIRLSEEVTFLNKASLLEGLSHIPEGAKVEIDASRSIYIDEDIKEIIRDFRDTAPQKGIDLTIVRPLDGRHKLGTEVMVPILKSTN